MRSYTCAEDGNLLNAKRYWSRFIMFCLGDGRGAIVRTWRLANVACSRMFREISRLSCLFALDIGPLFRCCVIGNGSVPPMLHLTQV